MVQRSYPGLLDPKRQLDPLKDAHRLLRKLQLNVKPFGRDYHAIAIALESLETTAFHFTRNPNYFGETGNHSG